MVVLQDVHLCHFGEITKTPLFTVLSTRAQRASIQAQIPLIMGPNTPICAKGRSGHHRSGGVTRCAHDVHMMCT